MELHELSSQQHRHTHETLRHVDELQASAPHKSSAKATNRPKSNKKNYPVELTKLTHPHQDSIRRVRLGNGLRFVKATDLRRLELENHVYRRHNSRLEEVLYEKNLQTVLDMLNEVQESDAAPRAGRGKNGGAEVKSVETIDLMDE